MHCTTESNRQPNNSMLFNVVNAICRLSGAIWQWKRLSLPPSCSEQSMLGTCSASFILLLSYSSSFVTSSKIVDPRGCMLISVLWKDSKLRDRGVAKKVLFLRGPSGREVISLQKEDSLLVFLNVMSSYKGFCDIMRWRLELTSPLPLLLPLQQQSSSIEEITSLNDKTFKPLPHHFEVEFLSLSAVYTLARA